MSKDGEHNDNNNSSNSSHFKAEKKEDVRSIAAEENSVEDKVEGDTEAQSDSDTAENLEDEDFSEDISEEDKETIKKVANDDNSSQAKSYASILVEQVMDGRETFERSLGSLFTSAFTAGLEIGISFFMILSAFALLSGVLPSHYAIVLASILSDWLYYCRHRSVTIIYRTNLTAEPACSQQNRALTQIATPLGHCHRR